MLYFGMLKEYFGGEREAIDVAAKSSVEDVLQALRNRVEDVPLWESMAVAVNREYSARSAVLHEGDEVALLPPVSGGAW